MILCLHILFEDFILIERGWLIITRELLSWWQRRQQWVLWVLQGLFIIFRCNDVFWFRVGWGVIGGRVFIRFIVIWLIGELFRCIIRKWRVLKSSLVIKEIIILPLTVFIYPIIHLIVSLLLLMISGYDLFKGVVWWFILLETSVWIYINLKWVNKIYESGEIINSFGRWRR